MDYAMLLRGIPMFQALEQDELVALAASLRERRYTAGQIIIEQATRGSEMYIVAEGHVEIFLTGDNSRRVSLRDIARGEYLGELSLFDDKPRSASALATTEVVLLELSRETLSRYLSTRPRVMMSLLETMAGRLRETNEMLSTRAAKNTVEEIENNLSWSQRLADRVAELNGSWAFIATLLALTLGWMGVNSMLPHRTFDPYPYVFFNLLLAVLVALQGPLIVMSQNRQSLKDRARADTDFNVNLKNEVNIEAILRDFGEHRAELNSRLAALEAISHSGAQPNSGSSPG